MSEIEEAELKTAMASNLLEDLLKERRSEHKWRWIRRVLWVGGTTVFAILMVVIQASKDGTLFSSGPGKDSVGVINVTGEISGSGAASANRLIPIIEKAFEEPKVKAIVLNINSPGGSPIEAEKINNFISLKRQQNNKPVYAVIDAVGASAAYMIAVHTDRIFSGRYSLVGSIGAIMQGWDVSDALKEHNIARRIYASGNLKGLMDPYAKMPPGGEEKAKTLVTQMGQEFSGEVTRARGKLLKPRDGVNLFSGEVWGGEEALDLGLVDEISTLDNVIQTKLKMPKFNLGPAASKGSILGLEMIGQGFAQVLLDRMDIRASSDPAPIEFKYSVR